jgi:archaellum component FlaC
MINLIIAAETTYTSSPEFVWGIIIASTLINIIYHLTQSKSKRSESDIIKLYSLSTANSKELNVLKNGVQNIKEESLVNIEKKIESLVSDYKCLEEKVNKSDSKILIWSNEIKDLMRENERQLTSKIDDVKLKVCNVSTLVESTLKELKELLKSTINGVQK